MVVAALALATVGCAGVRPTLGAPVASEALAGPVGGRVALVGDSLTVGEYATLPIAAESRGVRLDISAEPGRRISGAVPELARLARGHDLVVMALGTNDAADGLTPAAATALIDAGLAAAGADVPVLWLTVAHPAGTPAAEAAGVFNAALVDAAGRHGHLTVADWAGFVGGRPELVAGDGIHLTEDGYAVRTAWLVDRVLERLAQRTT